LATYGLEKLYYATITEDSEAIETYGTPQVLAKAIKVDISVEVVEESLYADNGACYIIKEFQSGKITLNTADLTPQVIADLTGASTDENGVMISASEDGGKTVAVGFRANRPEGKDRFYWLYKIKFGIPGVNLETKGKSISFQTPTIEGTILRRNKPDSNNRHPWMAQVVDGDPGVSSTTIANWFSSVYEASFSEL
jgi:phi13 family phage major tail protein